MDSDREHEQQGNDSLRASDADREHTIEALAAASAEGRLSLEEYSQRSDAALVARTVAELTGLTTDLPAPPRSDLAPVPVEITAVLGNESRKGPWVVPEHITVRSVLGEGASLNVHRLGRELRFPGFGPGRGPGIVGVRPEVNPMALRT